MARTTLLGGARSWVKATYYGQSGLFSGVQRGSCAPSCSPSCWDGVWLPGSEAPGLIGHPGAISHYKQKHVCQPHGTTWQRVGSNWPPRGRHAVHANLDSSQHAARLQKWPCWCLSGSLCGLERGCVKYQWSQVTASVRASTSDRLFEEIDARQRNVRHAPAMSHAD